MSELNGFWDEQAGDAEKLEYMCDRFSSVARSFGYEKVVVPTIEASTSFDESIVGKSPWPEWDKRGCFYLEVDDYETSFENRVSKTHALLIPEGTISVTRWLGRNYRSIKGDLPKKVFYVLPCFRNELVDRLSAGKRREFTQFGVEMLGSDDITADAEILLILNECLNTIGVSQENIRCRISDVGIFLELAASSGLNPKEIIKLKEMLDNLAEIKAGKPGVGLYPDKLKEAWDFLESFDLSQDQRRCWNYILSEGYSDEGDEEIGAFDDAHRDRFRALFSIKDGLLKLGVNVEIDLCVVRSHEYYTGISFEVDVLSEAGNFFEIAGGGRYNRLVENFEAEEHTVPSSGFAFGMQRLRQCLSAFDVFGSDAHLQKRLTFGANSADFVVEDLDVTIETFVSSAVALRERRKAGERWAYLCESAVDKHRLKKYADSVGASVKRSQT